MTSSTDAIGRPADSAQPYAAPPKEHDMLSKLAVRRLTKLADFMEALPRDKKHGFDMGELLHQEPCGTVACAYGWANTIPSFRKAGIECSIFWHGSAAQFFDLPYGNMDTIFGSDLAHTIRTPKQWAKHCRRFIRENT